MENVNTKSLGVIYGGGIGKEILEYICIYLQKLSPKLQINIFDKEINDKNLLDAIDFTHNNFDNNNIVISGPISGNCIYKYRKELGLIYKTVEIKALYPKIFIDNEHNVDFVIVRENNSGLFNGNHGYEKKDNEKYVYQTIEYKCDLLLLLMQKVNAIALQRKKKVTFLSKFHGLCELHTEIIKLAKLTLDSKIQFDVKNVDFALSDIINNPQNYDVIFTFDFIGDFVTDILINIFMGSRNIGFSINHNKNGCRVYQTISGTASDIAFKNLANPLGYLNIINEINNIYNIVPSDVFSEKLSEIQVKMKGKSINTLKIIDTFFDV